MFLLFVLNILCFFLQILIFFEKDLIPPHSPGRVESLFLRKNHTEVDVPHLLLCNQIGFLLTCIFFFSFFIFFFYLEPFKLSIHTKMPYGPKQPGECTLGPSPIPSSPPTCGDPQSVLFCELGFVFLFRLHPE